jgi:tricarballylate dehydrogenase
LAFTDVAFTDLPAVTADTIGGLAERLGLNPEALESTVAGYNGAIGPGEFNPYIFDGKSTLGLIPPKPNWAFPLN